MGRLTMLKGSVIAGGFLMLWALPAQAETTSVWTVSFDFDQGSGPVEAGTCNWEVIEADPDPVGNESELTVTSTCILLGNPSLGSFGGWIDLNSGYFELTGEQEGCITETASYTGVTDGYQIYNGVWNCGVLVDPFGTLCPAQTDVCGPSLDVPCCSFSDSFHRTDTDDDGVPDDFDICPLDYDPLQEDEDGDENGDACDVCPFDYDPLQGDEDEDESGDACDVCPFGDDGVDTDQDGIPDDCDIDMTGSWDVETSAGPCTTWEVTQTGTHLSMKAVCEFEIEAGVFITAESGAFQDPGADYFTGTITLPGAEGPGTGDFEVSGELRDPSTSEASVCRFVRFLGTTDGNSASGYPSGYPLESGYECWALPGDVFCPGATDSCYVEGYGDVPCCILTGSFSGTLIVDSDGDGVPDEDDNCPNDANPNQENSDTDEFGDACDACPEESEDYDGYQDEDGCRDHIDMTGTWDSTTVAGDCTWEIVQTGTQLDPFFIACGQGISASASAATIDVNTGVFNVTADLSPATCNRTPLSAQGTSDGDTANGTYWCDDEPGTVFCPVATHNCDGTPPFTLDCCYLTGSFSGTRVPDFVISDAPGGGDCENTRFNGSWNDADKTCTVANVTIHAGESLTVAQGATLAIMSGGAMTFNGGSADNSDTLVVWGTLANDGFMTFNGGDGSLSAYLSVSDGTLTNNGVMQFNGGAGYLSASLGVSIGATIANHNVMEFNGGAGEISAGISNTGEIVNDCFATIDMNGGTGDNSASLFTALQGTTINRGTINPTAGTGANSGALVGKDPVQGACPEDMTGGIWELELIGGLGGTCEYEFTQTGTQLNVEAWCDTTGPGSFTGTIDENTGEFYVEGSYRDACTVFASAAATVVGNSIIGGTWTCVEPAGTFTSDFIGTRFPDTDDDSVRDSEDNCPYNANPPRQPGMDQDDDLDGDGCGCPCDDGQGLCAPDEEWCPNEAAGSSFHVTTPVYRKKVRGPAIVEFSREEGLGTDRKPDIGLTDAPDADDSRVIKLTPVSVHGPAMSLNSSAKLKQSSWQSIMTEDLFTGVGAPIRFHIAPYANGFGMTYEIGRAEDACDEANPADCDMQNVIPPDEPVEIVQLVELPADWSIDASELTDGQGRLTIKDKDGIDQVRISSTGFAASGKLTELLDNADFTFWELLEQELSAQPSECTVPILDGECGANFYNPRSCVGGDYDGIPCVSDALCLGGGTCTGEEYAVEELLVLAEVFLEENQADGAPANTSVSPETCPPTARPNAVCYHVSMVVPFYMINENRGISKVILVSQKWSSLGEIHFPDATTTGKKVHAKHYWVCDDECVISGNNPTMLIHNTLPASPPTFNALPADYSLLPNGGGTGALRNFLEQQQAGVGCSGCTWNWTGESKIEFINGGAGVNITSGRRVGPGDPCLVNDPLDRTTNTGRCELDKVKRASFRAEKLVIEGSMGGLAASESDIEIDDLTFYQARDPNATDEVALHAAGGVGCKADSGRRTLRNPSDGELISSCPLDLNGCSEDDIGRGTCLPTHLCDPPSTGICNFKVKRMELHGMNSDNNPLGTDLTVPSGCGLTLASRAGKGEVGGKSYNPETGRCEASLEGDPEVSVIEGFECAMTTSGGANVDPETGAPLEADAAGAVPPNVYCLDKIRADKNEVGLVVGGNVDVRASRLDIRRTQFSAIHVKNSTANVETVDSTTAAGSPCPSDDGDTCRSPAAELACRHCKPGDVSYLAVAGRGKSVRTKLTITQSNIGLDENGNPSSGLNPALPELEVDDDLVATKTLTVGRAQASLYKAPIFYKKGADTIKDGLVQIKMSGNNIGVVSAIDSSTSIAIENRNSPEGDTGTDAEDNCYTTGNGDCLKSKPLVATGVTDAEIIETAVEVTDGASSAPKPAGSEVPGDHKCYSVWAKGATSLDQDVALIDEFFGLSTTATVLQPFEFCNPVNKNGEASPDPEAHLTCYDLDEDTPAVPTVEVSTQFGTHTVALGDANRLCVPTGVDLPLGDLEGRLNQFKCYERAKRAKKVPDGVVELTDRFETKSTSVKDLEEGPFLVCNAVHNGNGEGVVEGPGVAQHLACWKIQDADGQRKFSVNSVSLENQFGVSELDLSKARLLCEPAIVQVAP
jgi:hypothetical protein